MNYYRVKFIIEGVEASDQSEAIDKAFDKLLTGEIQVDAEFQGECEEK